MKRSILFAGVLALSGTIAAQANDLNQPRQAVVHFGDINVQQLTGAQILLNRIDAAATDVCGPAPDMRQLSAWQWYRSCRKDAVDHAVASLPFNLVATLDADSQPETLAQR